jgi:RNA polymerase sigma-70 factor (ECF subfamily)
LGRTDRGQFDKLRAGDRTACEEFVRRHYQGLYRWLCRLTGCRHAAEDLTQESFAAFWESLPRTTPRVGPRAWLYAVARNRWRKHCRDEARGRMQQREALAEMAGKGPSPSANLQREEFARALDAAVAQLAPEFREVFALRMWEEFDYAQIAEVQGISPELARWRFFRARTQIRDRLKAWQHVEEPCHGE